MIDYLITLLIWSLEKEASSIPHRTARRASRFRWFLLLEDSDSDSSLPPSSSAMRVGGERASGGRRSRRRGGDLAVEKEGERRRRVGVEEGGFSGSFLENKWRRLRRRWWHCGDNCLIGRMSCAMEVLRRMVPMSSGGGSYLLLHCKKSLKSLVFTKVFFLRGHNNFTYVQNI